MTREVDRGVLRELLSHVEEEIARHVEAGRHIAVRIPPTTEVKQNLLRLGASALTNLYALEVAEADRNEVRERVAVVGFMSPADDDPPTPPSIGARLAAFRDADPEVRAEAARVVTRQAVLEGPSVAAERPRTTPPVAVQGDGSELL